MGRGRSFPECSGAVLSPPGRASAAGARATDRVPRPQVEPCGPERIFGSVTEFVQSGPPTPLASASQMGQNGAQPRGPRRMTVFRFRSWIAGAPRDPNRLVTTCRRVFSGQFWLRLGRFPCAGRQRLPTGSAGEADFLSASCWRRRGMLSERTAPVNLLRQHGSRPGGGSELGPINHLSAYTSSGTTQGGR